MPGTRREFLKATGAVLAAPYVTEAADGESEKNLAHTLAKKVMNDPDERDNGAGGILGSGLDGKNFTYNRKNVDASLVNYNVVAVDHDKNGKIEIKRDNSGLTDGIQMRLENNPKSPLLRGSIHLDEKFCEDPKERQRMMSVRLDINENIFDQLAKYFGLDGVDEKYIVRRQTPKGFPNWMNINLFYIQGKTNTELAPVVGKVREKMLKDVLKRVN